MEKQYSQNKIEVRELEDGKLQLEILVNDFRESRMLQGKNGKFIENIKPQAKSLYNTIKEKGANGISFGFECLKDI